MDITCPQCKTEYEFEDAKITEVGVTVKCTNCTYMFKVRRKAVVETEPILPPPTPTAELGGGGGASRPWMIRTGAGQVLNFKELTTLQQWIVERRVGRDDHISKSGETWKRLGDIAELASFFQVVDAAMAADSSGSAPRPRPPSGPAPQQRPSSQQPQRPRSSSAGGSGPLRGVPSDSAFGDPGALGAAGDGEPAFAASSSPGFRAVGQSAAWEEGGVRLSGRHATVDPGDEELPRRRTGRTLGLALLVLVLGVGGILSYLYRERVKAIFSGGSGEGSGGQGYQAARKLYLQDDEDSLREADAQLSRLTTPLAEAARAEVLGTWAEHVRLEAELAERRARLADAAGGGEGEAKTLRLRASTLREEADRKIAQAESLARRAVEGAAEKGEVKRAMADVLRLAGRSPAEVQPFLTDARKMLPSDPETLFVEGAYYGAQGNQARAEELVKEALTKTKARYGQLLMRAAVYLAGMQLKADRRPEARAQAEAILQASPRHRWAIELLEVIRAEERTPVAHAAADARPGAAAGSGAGAGTGAGTAAGTGAGTGGPGPVAKPGEKGTKPGEKGGGVVEPPANATYEALITQGNALSEKGRTMQAFKLFERALKLRANGVEALVGIGYCHLDQERFAQAISYFKRALTSAPTNGDALIGMGEAYKVQGNYAKALDYYRAYLAAQPGGTKSVLAKRNVADLERKVGAATPSPGTATPTPGTGTGTTEPPRPPDPVPTPPPPAPTPEEKAPSTTP